MNSRVLLLHYLQTVITYGYLVGNEDRQRNKVNLGKTEVLAGLEIHEISDLDYERSTYKISVTMELVAQDVENAIQGTYSYRFDNTKHLFNLIQILGKQVRPQEQSRLVRTNVDGYSSSISRFNAELVCPYNFQRYPFDVQRCSIMIVASSHFFYFINQTSEAMSTVTLSFIAHYADWILTLSWFNTSAAIIAPEAVLPPNVYVSLVSATQCQHKAMFSASRHTSSFANFGCLEVTLQFSRSLTLSAIRYIIPSSVFVIATFFSPYIDRTNLQTRFILIGFSSILFSISVLNMKSEIPSTVYFTGTDVWICLCSIFIFLAFIEVIAVNILMNFFDKRLKLSTKDNSLRMESQYRHERNASKKEQYNTLRISLPDTESADGRRLDNDPMTLSRRSDYAVVISNYFHRQADFYSITAARVDLVARIILPIAFFITLLIYVVLFIAVKIELSSVRGDRSVRPRVLSDGQLHQETGNWGSNYSNILMCLATFRVFGTLTYCLLKVNHRLKI
uniref:Neur_chan_LBD domain-containing protein n=1 Tax=Syphacia muris TaxID=451379 RepID=A0A0N5A7Q2_9BILA